MNISKKIVTIFLISLTHITQGQNNQTNCPPGTPTEEAWLTGATPSGDSSITIVVPGTVCPGEEVDLDYSNFINGATVVVREEGTTNACSSYVYESVVFSPSTFTIPAGAGGTGSASFNATWSWSHSGIVNGATSGNGTSTVTITFNRNAATENKTSNQNGSFAQSFTANLTNKVANKFGQLSVDLAGVQQTLAAQLAAHKSSHENDPDWDPTAWQAFVNTVTTQANSAGQSAATQLSSQVLLAGQTVQTGLTAATTNLSPSVTQVAKYTHCQGLLDPGFPGWSSQSITISLTGVSATGSININIPVTATFSIPKIASLTTNASFVLSGSCTTTAKAIDTANVFLTPNSSSSKAEIFTKTDFESAAQLTAQSGFVGIVTGLTVDYTTNNPTVTLQHNASTSP